MFVLRPDVEKNSTTTEIHCWSGCRINAPSKRQKANRLRIRSIGRHKALILTCKETGQEDFSMQMVVSSAGSEV